jgi:hypothetical protein
MCCAGAGIAVCTFEVCGSHRGDHGDYGLLGALHRIVWQTFSFRADSLLPSPAGQKHGDNTFFQNFDKLVKYNEASHSGESNLCSG